MSRRIYKKELNMIGETIIFCPPGIKVLGVQVQNNKAVIYIESGILLDGRPHGNVQLKKKTFMSAMTGECVPEQSYFIGTLMFSNGEFVTHVYGIED